eukprot:288621-Amorphochlora_amoeboformis.AAC.1
MESFLRKVSVQVGDERKTKPAHYHTVILTLQPSQCRTRNRCLYTHPDQGSLRGKGKRGRELGGGQIR